MNIRGKHHPVEVFDIFEADDASTKESKRSVDKDFRAGQDFFEQSHYADAVKCFSEVLKVMPEDRATQIYLERAARFLLGPGAQDDE